MVAPVLEVWLHPENTDTYFSGGLRVEYAETNVTNDDVFGDVAGTTARGQSFKASTTVDIPIARVAVWLKKFGTSHADGVRIEVHSNATFTALMSASNVIPASAIGTGYAWHTFDLGPYLLQRANITYYFAVKRTGALDGSNYYAVGVDITGDYPTAGTTTTLHEYFLNVATWTAQTAFDLAFRIYDVNAEITSDVRPNLRITMGRTKPWGAADPGACDLELRNRNRQYSPLNTIAPWYGILVPGCGIEVRYEDEGAALLQKRFRGHVDTLEVAPETKNLSFVRLRCLDALAYACKRAGPIYTRMTGAAEGNLEGQNTFTALTAVLAEAGYTGAIATDGTATILDTFWVNGEDAYAAIRQIAVEELGFIVHLGSNIISLQSRVYRDGLSPSLTVDENDYTAISPYKLPAEATFNYTETRAQPRRNATEYSTIVFPEVFQIAAGATKTVWITWDNPATLPLTATAWGTRHLANDNADGTGTDRTASVTLTHNVDAYQKATRQRCDLLNNHGSAVWITLLQAGCLARVENGDGHDVYAEDTAAKVLQNGRLAFPERTRWIGSLSVAQAWADRVIADFASPRDMIEITFMPRTIADRNALIARSFSDIITVFNQQIFDTAGVNFFIERIEDTFRDKAFSTKLLLSRRVPA